MPVYTYQCESCGLRFDQKQKFSDEPVKVCPECGAETHRVIGPVGVVFKGSGFYVNDSRTKNPANEPASKKAESSTASSDAKPETPAKNSGTANSSAVGASSET